MSFNPDSSLAKIKPEILEQWDYDKNSLNPDKVGFSSKKFAYWLCDEGHSFEQRIGDRGNTKYGCKECSPYSLGDNNMLSMVYPESLDQWDYNKNRKLPQNYGYKSNAKVWWTCEENHSFERAIYKQVESKIKCTVCHSLPFQYPEIAKEYHPTKNNRDVNTLTSWSKFNSWWLCSKGHEYQSSTGDRVHKTSGCPFCSGRQATPEYNLKVHSPEIAQYWDYTKNSTTPEQVTPSSHTKYWWTCNKNHSYEDSPNTKQEKPNCPRCFDLDVKGYFYLCEDKTGIKFGIAKNIKSRLRSHNNLHNLKTIGYIEFDSYYEAKQFEKQVKKFVSENSLYRRVHKKWRASGQTEVISKLKLSRVIDLDMFGFLWLMEIIKEKE